MREPSHMKARNLGILKRVYKHTKKDQTHSAGQVGDPSENFSFHLNENLKSVCKHVPHPMKDHLIIVSRDFRAK